VRRRRRRGDEAIATRGLGIAVGVAPDLALAVPLEVGDQEAPRLGLQLPPRVT
jgi:hypothetical protein